MGCDDVSWFTSSERFSADPQAKSAAADLGRALFRLPALHRTPIQDTIGAI
jgi:hypothetical protein